MELSDRFNLFLRDKGVSQKEFSDTTGYLRQSLSKIVTGKTKMPKSDFIIALMKSYPDLNLKWLLLGEGEMYQELNPIVQSQEALINELRLENDQLKEELSFNKQALLDKEKIIQLLEEKLK